MLMVRLALASIGWLGRSVVRRGLEMPGRAGGNDEPGHSHAGIVACPSSRPYLLCGTVVGSLIADVLGWFLRGGVQEGVTGVRREKEDRRALGVGGSLAGFGRDSGSCVSPQCGCSKTP